MAFFESREERLQRRAKKIIFQRDLWERRHPGKKLSLPDPDKAGRKGPLAEEVLRQLGERDKIRAVQISADLAAMDAVPSIITTARNSSGSLRERVVDRTKEFGGAMRELLEIDRQRRIAAGNRSDGKKVSFFEKRLRKIKEYVKRKGVSRLLLEIVGLFFIPKGQRLIAGIWYGLKTASGIGSDRFLEAARIYAEDAGFNEQINLRKREIRFANLIAVMPFISKGDVRKVVEGVKYVNAALDRKATTTPQPAGK